MASVVIFDVAANIPSATIWNSRFFFYATDTNTMYVSDGSTWQTVGTGSGVLEVTDGSTTVSPVSEIDFTSGATVTDGGSGIAQVAVTAAADLSVTDGTTTVDPVSEIDFTSGATVTDGGSGVAEIAIAGSSQPLTHVESGLGGGDSLWYSPFEQYYPAGASTDGAPGQLGTALTTIPVVVAAMGTVATVGPDFIVTVIPVDVDILDVEATLYVTDLTGTNSIEVDLSGSTTAGDTSLTLPWTGAVSTTIAGTDLAWDGTNVVTSTAGGIFVASLVIQVFWD